MNLIKLQKYIIFWVCRVKMFLIALRGITYYNSRNTSGLEINGTNGQNKQGLGLGKFLTHVTPDCQDLITRLLVYNPEERFSAKQALAHPHFKDLVEQEAKQTKISTNNFNSVLIKSFHNDSQNQIRSTEDSQLITTNPNKKQKDKDKDKDKDKAYLPEIKVNIIIDSKKGNDSYESDGGSPDVRISINI
jgi:serine/threonine protein kinase